MTTHDASEHGADRLSTKREQAEAALRVSEAFLSEIFNVSPCAQWISDENGTLVRINQACKELFHVTDADVVGKYNVFKDNILEDQGFMPRVRAVFERGETARFTLQYNTRELQQLDLPDNMGLVLEVKIAPLLDNDGKVISAITQQVDVTERERAETARQALLEIMRGLVVAQDLHDLLGLVHRSIARVIHAKNFFVILYNAETASFEEVYSVDKFDPSTHPSLLEDSISAHVFRTGQPLLLTQEPFDRLAARGEVKLVGTDSASWLGVPLKTGDATIGVMAVQDYDRPDRYSDRDTEFFVSIAGQVALAVERKRTEEELKKRSAFVETLLENAPIGFAVNTISDGRAVFVSSNFERIYGVPPGSMLDVGDYFDHVYLDPVFREEIRERVLADMASGDAARMRWEDIPITTRTGERKFITAVNIPLPEQDLMVSTVQDVTERKRAEEDKARLEIQLRQSHKMESVGRLAGGVAHDFNNMLGVILGHAEMAIERVGPDDPLYDDLQEIRLATERSADLTRQLLAFARKQTIAPRVLDLNMTVESMLSMLKRLIGEDIELVWRPGAALWPVKADPSQIDQILANLSANARDAITGVGKMTVETANRTLDDAFCSGQPDCVPGEYVRLTVSDDGLGMTRETLSHIFEPFFTTKRVGNGTGLGLATVYGIVKQNNGFVDVYSEPNEGTTFAIYLPRHASETDRARTEALTEPVARGHETILLVEDEPAILRMTTRLLESQGYTVLAAGTPGEAMRLAQEHAGQIPLLVADVVMPEMNGRELANNLLTLYPDLKRVFMSGYTADVIAHHGVLDEGVYFIQKPFSRQTLAAKVREALDGD